jgi:hypothetical protein
MNTNQDISATELGLKMSANIDARRQMHDAIKAEFESAVRTQLGYPDHALLPSDPLFQRLYKQMGAIYSPKISLELHMVPAKKKAMILTAIHSILTR